MWPDRRLIDLFGIEHPIILAPMAGSGTPELVAAVANAGGMGSLGCAMLDAEGLAGAVVRIRAATNGVFNLNFFAIRDPAPDAETLSRMAARLQPWYRRYGVAPPPAPPPAPAFFDQTRLRQVLDLAPPVVSFHFGLPQHDAVTALKAAGIKMLSTATTVTEARALELAGVDAVIAQGFEAGGHRGAHRPNAAQDGVGTLSLVPQIADVVSVPVIAAGGIADGRGIAAAFALGASGVQMGTAFLLCPEAATDARRRERIRNASADDTMMTAAVSGRPARARRSRYAEAMAAAGTDLPSFPALYALTGPLLEAAGAEDDEVSFHLYGQSAALAREAPAGEIVARLVEQSAAAFARLAGPRG